MVLWVYQPTRKATRGRYKLIIRGWYEDELKRLGLTYHPYVQKRFSSLGRRSYHLALWMPNPAEALYLMTMWGFPRENVVWIHRPESRKPCPA
jgi:hypothetical protein